MLRGVIHQNVSEQRFVGVPSGLKIDGTPRRGCKRSALRNIPLPSVVFHRAFLIAAVLAAPHRNRIELTRALTIHRARNHLGVRGVVVSHTVQYDNRSPKVGVTVMVDTDPVSQFMENSFGKHNNCVWEFEYLILINPDKVDSSRRAVVGMPEGPVRKLLID